jgi:hypothetical protein
LTWRTKLPSSRKFPTKSCKKFHENYHPKKAIPSIRPGGNSFAFGLPKFRKSF